MTNEQMMAYIKKLEARIDKLEKSTGRRKKTSEDIHLRGRVFADRVYTRRSGSYVELTT